MSRAGVDKGVGERLTRKNHAAQATTIKILEKAQKNKRPKMAAIQGICPKVCMV